MIKSFGGKPEDFPGRPQRFKFFCVMTNIRRNCGWDAAICIFALTAAEPRLHEDAPMDGASILKRVIHIDLPSIAPTMVTMPILPAGFFFKTCLGEGRSDAERTEPERVRGH